MSWYWEASIHSVAEVSVAVSHFMSFLHRQKPPGQNQNQNQLLFVPETKRSKVLLFFSALDEMDEIPFAQGV